MDPANGNRSSEPEESGGVKTGGSDPSSGGRPGWSGLLAAGAVVLLVGGFALSRNYGVQSIPSPPDLEEVATPTTSSSPVRSVTTVPVIEVGLSDSIDWDSFDWMTAISEVAFTSDGALYAVGPGGIAWQYQSQMSGLADWELIDVDALPVGTGLDDGWPSRTISQVAAGPGGNMWVAGFATSHADDEEFGGIIDGWTGGRVLYWIASYHCPLCRAWTVWTANEVPELAGDIGDLVVSSDGIVYASVGENTLLVFDGQLWESFEVPLPDDELGASYPWSGSLAIGTDGVVWAATWKRGLFAFDGSGFTRYTTEDGLPGNHTFQVAAAVDGSVWVATDALYGSPETASPDEAAGIASFDGTTWITYTMEDGLLSNDAVVATGADGTVWAVHSEIPPYGYSRFGGTGWTTWQFDGPVIGYGAEVAPDGTVWGISMGALISFDGTNRITHASPFGQLLPGTVTVVLNGLEGFEGLVVSAWLLPLELTEEKIAFGGTGQVRIREDPYLGSEVMHPQDDSYFSVVHNEVATFEPGTYRFIIEAYVPLGDMYYGCEQQVQVIEGEPLVVTISSLPTYTGEGWHWAPYDQLEYPDCP